MEFSGQLYFRRRYIFGEALFSKKLYFTALVLEKLLRHNSYIFGAAISSEQLLFLRSSVFERVIFLQQLFFQNTYFFEAKLLLSSHVLRIGSSLGQLLLGTDTFLADELLRIKISTEELLCRSMCFCTAPAFTEELHFRKS